MSAIWHVGHNVGHELRITGWQGRGQDGTVDAAKANETGIEGASGHKATRCAEIFKTGALNRSATHPGRACYSVRAGGYISDRRHKYC
jgi:hypothetical protein